MKQIDTIRAALELAREIIPPMFATHAKLEDGLSALAELERAAAEPVTYQYSHPSGGGKIWRNEQHWNGYTSNEARALYAAPPAPVAEIREPTAEECERIGKLWDSKATGLCRTGRDMFQAVRAVMWPKGGE